MNLETLCKTERFPRIKIIKELSQQEQQQQKQITITVLHGKCSLLMCVCELVMCIMLS